MKKLTIKQAQKLLLEQPTNAFCSVIFHKVDGTLRKMVFQRKISSDLLTGKGRNYDPADHGLQTVMEVTKTGRQIRNFAWDRVSTITMNRETFAVR